MEIIDSLIFRRDVHIIYCSMFVQLKARWRQTDGVLIENKLILSEHFVTMPRRWFEIYRLTSHLFGFCFHIPRQWTMKQLMNGLDIALCYRRPHIDRLRWSIYIYVIRSMRRMKEWSKCVWIIIIFNSHVLFLLVGRRITNWSASKRAECCH